MQIFRDFFLEFYNGVQSWNIFNCQEESMIIMPKQQAEFKCLWNLGISEKFDLIEDLVMYLPRVTIDRDAWYKSLDT